jgi:hypothetical protein
MASAQGCWDPDRLLNWIGTALAAHAHRSINQRLARTTVVERAKGERKIQMAQARLRGPTHIKTERSNAEHWSPKVG